MAKRRERIYIAIAAVITIVALVIVAMLVKNMEPAEIAGQRMAQQLRTLEAQSLQFRLQTGQLSPSQRQNILGCLNQLAVAQRLQDGTATTAEREADKRQKALNLRFLGGMRGADGFYLATQK